MKRTKRYQNQNNVNNTMHIESDDLVDDDLAEEALVDDLVDDREVFKWIWEIWCETCLEVVCDDLDQEDLPNEKMFRSDLLSLLKRRIQELAKQSNI